MDAAALDALLPQTQCTRCGYPSCREYAEAMADGVDLDAVIVCTPPVTHREVCCGLLERGLHVLCEKPLSISSAAAAS